jgi:microsomal dipeptidase-like Zn-dependent dipeptidase
LKGRNDRVGDVLRKKNGHSTSGYPQFDGWPKWNTADHQQMYSDWLYRALQGGLRLMVMHAVNNEVLCRVLSNGAARRCDDMETVDSQLAGAKRMEGYIDSLNGGHGRGWYRIAYSSMQARQIISEGKLAVVLGIEVDNLFGCRIDTPCTSERVRSELNRYHDLGVRHLFPIHFANNGFGGFAVFGDPVLPIFSINDLVLNNRIADLRSCSKDDIHFQFTLSTSIVYTLLSVYLGRASLLPLRASGLCNSQGLTALGTDLINDMMDLGMIVDIDHMSMLAADSTLRIARVRNYTAIIAGHTGFVESSLGTRKSEGQKTHHQIAAIDSLGGMVSVVLYQGDASEIAWSGSKGKVANDCSQSSKTWAQAYLYAVDQLGGNRRAAVGLASDQLLNPFVAPRFGTEACALHSHEAAAQDSATRVHYPIAPLTPGPPLYASHSGDRTFVYDTDGLAHIGMLPDFIQDLQNIGLTKEDLGPLFRSAEAYIRMWERAEEFASAHSQSVHSP